MVKIRQISLYCRSWNTDHGPRVKRVCKKIMAQFRMILKNKGSQMGSQGCRQVSQRSQMYGRNVAIATILPQLNKIQGNFATFATPCDPLATPPVGDYLSLIPTLIGHLRPLRHLFRFFYVKRKKILNCHLGVANVK
jgi:hypothetical protein